MQNRIPNFLILIAITFILLLSNSLFGQIKEFGIASFYADKFEGRITASGEIFEQAKLTAAHRTLPFGAIVKVVNVDNNKSIEVRINDRGPFVDNRVIDLTRSAAKALGFDAKGVANVRLEVINIPSPTEPRKTKDLAVATSKPANESQPDTKPVSESAPKEYFKIETKALTPIGFGIQIASYQEAANLLKLCNTIQEEIKHPLMIQVSEANNGKVYRIIIGPFEAREEAERFKNKLNGYSDSFIIGL